MEAEKKETQQKRERVNIIFGITFLSIFMLFEARWSQTILQVDKIVYIQEKCQK